jgi:hypothetical protein
MSSNDSFIDEVNEEVRRDKLYAAFRKYGWIGVVAVLLIVGGSAWNEYTKAAARTKAQAFGDAVLAAMANNDPAARVTALDAVTGDPSQTGVLQLLAASEAVAATDVDAALAGLRKVADDAALPVIYRDLARLKLVTLAGDKIDTAERDNLLATIAAPGAPYRLLAMEQQALVMVADGKPADAVTLLRAILKEQGLTAALQRRVTQLIVALGEDPSAA